jgi:hypothetical protein
MYDTWPRFNRTGGRKGQGRRNRERVDPAGHSCSFCRSAEIPKPPASPTKAQHRSSQPPLTTLRRRGVVGSSAPSPSPPPLALRLFLSSSSFPPPALQRLVRSSCPKLLELSPAAAPDASLPGTAPARIRPSTRAEVQDSLVRLNEMDNE